MRGKPAPSAEQEQRILGDALRALRKEREITQEQLAERLGVDPTFIGRLERGQRGAHWRTIRRILTALETSVSDFAAAIEASERGRRR
ncbi:MAG: helix-turn-helix domain-containing protein [Solirubrobacteraceae bacterium]